MAQIKIKRILVSDLERYYTSLVKMSNANQIFPISLKKATAHQHNPNADNNDTGLIVALDGDRLVGYLGLLPGVVRVEDNEEKISFLTTLLVDPAYRRQGIASKIYQEAFSLETSLLATGYTKAAFGLYRKLTQFKKIKSYQFLRIDLFRRSSLHHLSYLIRRLEKTPRLKNLNLLFYLPVRIIRKPLELVLWRNLKSNVLKNRPDALNNIEFNRVKQISREAYEVGIVSKKSHKICFVRDLKTINWVIKYPWIIEKYAKLNYEFAYSYETFKILAFELKEAHSDHLIGFAIYSVSRPHGYTMIRILDFGLANGHSEEIILRKAVDLAEKWKADVIEGEGILYKHLKSMTNLDRVSRLSKRGNFIYTDPVKSTLPERPVEIHLAYCDSDVTFC